MSASAGYYGFMQVAKIALATNVGGFLVTSLLETHKITDLIGTGSFAVAAVYGLLKCNNAHATQKALTYSATLWSIRLSAFLFYRVCTVGGDKRLEFMFPNRSKGETWFSKPPKGGSPRISNLAMFWVIQTIWCIIVLSPVTAAQYVGKPLKQMTTMSKIGIGAFFVFFLFESIADFQKYSFKQNAANKGKFMNQGLYKYCQFPNYFGEIGIWISLFMAAIPVLPRNYLFTVISPLFITFLLTKVSGIPMMEKQWKSKYSHLKQFQQYRQNTNKLIPWFPKSN